MDKLITLKLTKIKYDGDSIGNDIHVEMECLGKFITLKKRLKKGVETGFDIDVGQFFAGEEFFELPLNIKIIERDLIFNDIGFRKENFKINLAQNGSQYFTSTVEINESRNYKTKRKAFFEIKIEALVSDRMMYVIYAKNGWIMVVMEDTKKVISIPSYLKVQLDRSDSKRHFFKIMEGPFKGNNASVKIETSGMPYLQSLNPHTETAHLTYSISKKILKFGNKTYKTEDYKSNPWKKGFYDIEIPDAPHQGGSNYLTKAKLARVWFRIGHSGERYLHTGLQSLGCITITENDRWDDLCHILLKARKGDGLSIGILEVID